MAKEFNLEIEINASIEKCWKVITQSSYVKEYMFGASVESDWEEGASLTYFIDEQGQRMDMVYGEIETINSPSRLRHTLIPAQADYERIPENFIFCDYRLNGNEEKTVLSIHQGGFEGAAEGEARYQSAQKGWDAVLPKMKEIAERI